MAQRLLLAATVRHDAPVSYRYYLDSRLIDDAEFAATLKAASLAKRLTHTTTQSTGFGWRTLWEIA